MILHTVARSHLQHTREIYTAPKKECLDFIPKKASPHAEQLVATSAVGEVPMFFQELETPRNPLVMTNIEGQWSFIVELPIKDRDFP